MVEIVQTDWQESHEINVAIERLACLQCRVKVVLSSGELQPLASSGSEASLVAGAGQYDMDTPTDGVKCRPGSSLSRSNHGCTD